MIVNLASRPFRNETLPSVLLGLGAVVVLALSVWHGVVIHRLRPAQTSALDTEVSKLEADLPRLRAEAASMRATSPVPDTLKQWIQVKGLVDRRAFSWTGLLSRLEAVTPNGVRITAITPDDPKQGAMVLELAANVQSTEVGLDFIKLLEERPEFEDVWPRGVAKHGDSQEKECRYVVRYRPSAVPAVEAPKVDTAPGEETLQEPSEDVPVDEGEAPEEEQP